MTAYGWDNDAGTLQGNLTGAINSALGIASPATTMIPTGVYVSQGIGSGMKSYVFASDAQAVGTAVSTALSAAMPATSFKAIGFNAMLGLASGIRLGRPSVISAMRSAAQAAVAAAKSALQIKSPSRVFRDEVGVMMMRGLGEGVKSELEHQQRIIANAARYLADTAVFGGTVSGWSSKTTNNDNRNQSANINIETYNANGEDDVDRLMRRLNARSRSMSRGYGHA